MPRLINDNHKHKYTRGNDLGHNYHKKPMYYNWFFTSTNLETLEQIETFKRKPFSFLQYQITTFVNEHGFTRYNLRGYVQTHQKTRSSMCKYINCKTDIKPTTIAEKFSSDFNDLPDLISHGIERLNVEQSQSGIDLINRQCKPLHTNVTVNSSISCKRIKHNKKKLFD